MRKDGRRLKDIDPMYKLLPHILQDRIGSQIYYTLELLEEPFDIYIKDKYSEGHNISLMAIVITSCVRLFALKPALNRFIIHGRVYARNGIQISMVIKKKLTEESGEETIKFSFSGNESVFDVQEMIDSEVKRLKKENELNEASRLTWFFGKMPNMMVRIGINLIWGMDVLNIMPNSLQKASPFHASMFFTNLRSIKLDKLYHHLYEFGTVGSFVSLGKTIIKPVVINGEIAIKKAFKLGLVFDERLCDGYYFSSSLRLFESILEDLNSLDSRLQKIEQDIK